MPPQQRSSVAPGALGSRSENLNTLTYRLCEHDELPTIDCKKAVKHVLIRAPRAQRRLNAFIHTTKRVWLVANLVGMTCVFTYPLFPLYWSRVVATAGAICVFVPVNLTLLVMRFDMIVLLMRTYEFWYLTAMNVLCTVLLSVEYADPRGFAIAIGSIAVQNGIMTDANYRVVKTVAFWSTLAALMYGGMAIAELLSALPDVRRLRIIRHSRWSVESNEVNANGLLTIAVIMLRNAYRRHAFVSTMKKDVPSVRLVSYRTYLRFVPSTRDVQAITPVVISPTPAPSSRLDPPPSEAPAYKQLQLAPTLSQIHVRDVLSGGIVMDSRPLHAATITFTEDKPGPATPQSNDKLCALLNLTAFDTPIQSELKECSELSTFQWGGTTMPTTKERLDVCRCTSLMEKFKLTKIPRCVVVMEEKHTMTGMWDDPVIVAMRIPIDVVTFGPVISRGGYGEVYRGEYRGETVAIKRLLPERRKDLRQIQAFLGEVKMMAGMEHDRIVRFVGVAWSSLSDLCVVSEFMERALTVGLLAAPLPSRAESLRGLSAERRLRVTFTEQNPGPSTPSATDPLCAYMDLSVQNAQIYVELLDCTQRSTFNWAGSDLPTDAQRKQLCGCTALIKKLKSLKLPRCTAILSGKSMTYKGVMEYAFAYCDDPGTPSQSSTVTDNSDNQSTFSPSYSNNDNSNSNANSNRWTSSSEDEDKKNGMSTATIGAIIGAAVVVIVLIGFTTYRCGKKRREGAMTTGPASARSPSINDDVSGNYSTVTASTTTKNVNTKQTRTTTSTGTGSSNGDRMNRAESTLWDDPVIVAMRIPIDAVTFGPVISRGGYGEVYRGEYRGETVAIKRLLPERRKDLRQIQAFLGEVKMMAGMEHDRIVRFVGVAWSSLSDLCVVSEFMERGDLRSSEVLHRVHQLWRAYR
ncbi:hypothetical protein P43SY_000868 [Pythium insidiosum]|uniref:Protein kinase domain-containing protein n=1 Tax=Pythium insidiosum TaxID=114742 RepID=A0AAD5LN74_PYTIN|nr:hypothetical protein P43SY_000868 [Pythium insidiosum]